MTKELKYLNKDADTSNAILMIAFMDEMDDNDRESMKILSDLALNKLKTLSIDDGYEVVELLCICYWSGRIEEAKTILFKNEWGHKILDNYTEILWQCMVTNIMYILFNLRLEEVIKSIDFIKQQQLQHEEVMLLNAEDPVYLAQEYVILYYILHVSKQMARYLSGEEVDINNIVQKYIKMSQRFTHLKLNPFCYIIEKIFKLIINDRGKK